MSVTITPLRRGHLIGGLDVRVADVLFDSSYPTGGEPISPSEVGLNSILGAIDLNGGTGDGGYRFKWDPVNNKLLAFRASGFTPAGTVAVSMTDGSRINTYAPGGGDLKGATNLAGTEGNADQAAGPVNAALLLAEDTFTNFAGTMTPTTQPDVPRNVVIVIDNTTGGALDLFEGTTTFAITGTSPTGAAQTENVTLVSTAGNKSVASAKFRFVQGVKPFATVTSVAITNAPAGALSGSLGVGTRIGLPSALDTGVLADVIDITVTGARVAPTATVANAGGVDTTNNAINTGTTADGFDLGVIYKEDFDGAAGTATFTGTPVAAGALIEVANAVNLSAITARLLFIG